MTAAKTIGAVLLGCAVLAAGVAVATASPPGTNSLVCHDRYQTSSTDSIHTRLIGDSLVSPVAPTRLFGWPPNPNVTGDRFIKHGIVVTAGAPVTLSVPGRRRACTRSAYANPVRTVAESRTRLVVAPCARAEGAATGWPGELLRPAAGVRPARRHGRRPHRRVSLSAR